MKPNILLPVITMCTSSIFLIACSSEEDTVSGACNTTLPFNDANFNYYSTANNTLVPSDNTELELIPDDFTSVGTAVFLEQAITPPYSIEFEYTVFDDDGETNILVSTNSGDGIVVMLLKDESPYNSVEPPTGSSRGYHPGDGYGVHFDIYGTRNMHITDGAGAQLAYFQNFAPSVYPHGEWRRVKVTVRSDSIVVGYDGRSGFIDEFLRYDGNLVLDYSGLAIGAATGGSDGQHKIRNVTVCSL